MEAVQAGRAVLAVAGRDRRRGPSRLAHRMLGDGAGSISASSSTFTAAGSIWCSRITRTRSRRSCCAFHASDGNYLDAQRLSAGRRREDVEEPRQLRHHPRPARGLAGRSAAPEHAEDALPIADRLDAEIGLEESARTLDDWYRVAADISPGRAASSVLEPLLDDLNTPLAIAALHGLRNSDVASLAGFVAPARLPVRKRHTEWEGRKRQASGVDAGEVERLIAERTAARGRKDFRESDRIRDQLAAMGIAIKDSKDGTTWEVAR